MKAVLISLTVLLGGCVGGVLGALIEIPVDAAIHAASRPEPPRIAEPVDPSPQLLMAARSAAQRGDCTAVVQHASALFYANRAMHDRLYLEPSIDVCLERARVGYAAALFGLAIAAARNGECNVVLDLDVRLARIDRGTRVRLHADPEATACFPPPPPA